MLDFPPPLDTVDEIHKAVLAKFTEPVELEKGTVLFRMNDEADGFFIIDEGTVRVEIDREGHNPDEPDNVLAFLEARSVVGELGLLDELPRSASAIAQTDVKLRKFALIHYVNLQKEHPDVANALIAALGRAAALKLRDTSTRLDNLVGSKKDALVESMIDAALKAQAEFSGWSEDRVDRLTFEIASAVEAEAETLARIAVEETGMGNVDDKTLKNRFASLGVWHSFHGKPGAGVVLRRRMEKITDVASPVGLVFGIVPITNPTSTFVFKVLIGLKSRNALILSPNRGALECCNRVGEIVEEVLRRNGAPDSLVQWINSRNSRKQVITFMNHPKVGMVLATGGPSVVKAAYNSGNPAIGVGSGNAPTLVCGDADLGHAAASIVSSKAFDCGLICGAEHNILVVKNRRDALVAELEKAGAAVLKDAEVARFKEAVIDPRSNTIRAAMTGQSAAKIAALCGVERAFEIKVLVVPDAEIQAGNPMSREKLAPILSLYCVDTEEDGFAASQRLLEIDGQGHTAIIYTKDRQRALAFGAAMKASRILVNSPGAHGVVGISTNLEPSLTLGCGTFGGTSTTDNVTFTHLRNVKRVAYFAPERLMLLSDRAARLLRHRSLWVSKIGRKISWLYFRTS